MDVITCKIKRREFAETFLKAFCFARKIGLTHAQLATEQTEHEVNSK